MPLLFRDEEEALTRVLARYNQQDLDAFLLLNGGPRICDFSSTERRMPSIIIELLGWLRQHGDKLPGLLVALAREAGNSTEVPLLEAAATRIRQSVAQAMAMGPPTRACLAGGVPIVDRAVLRSHLDAAINDADDLNWDVKFIKVSGESGLGRSHSWHLIKFVADAGVAKAVKFDLKSLTLANQTLDVLFDAMVHHLELDGDKPIATGVTAETLAALYASEIARCLDKAASSWTKPLWLVFDSLNGPFRPEIKRFVANLVEARLDKGFTRCAIFLLGPDPVIQPLDQWQLGRSEEVLPFDDRDIDVAAEFINNLGTRKLPATELAARVGAMLALRAGCSTRQFHEKIADQLVQLRNAVRA